MAVLYKVDDDAFNPSLFQGSSCAFGVFDGVHEGHRYLINSARQSAAQNGGKSVVLTFDIDPDEVFRADSFKKLMTNDERLAMLCATGVDAVVVLPFTREFASLSPEEFLTATFGAYPPAYLHVGDDFRFGAKNAGTVSTLDDWAARSQTQICAHHLVSQDGDTVTATRIRHLLSEGAIAEANKLLQRPYFQTGRVIAGRGEGADMGFRTANLEIPTMLQALGDGVYAAYVVVNGTRYKAAVNVGIAATFAENSVATCEAHILDFAEDIYGDTISIEFIEWLRPQQVFDDVDTLIATVKSNIEWVRTNL